MSLADQLAAQTQRPGFSCYTKRWLDTLNADLRVEVLAAFRDQRVSARVLSDWAQANGAPVKVSRSAVDRHRTGACTGCTEAGYDVRRGA